MTTNVNDANAIPKHGGLTITADSASQQASDSHTQDVKITRGSFGDLFGASITDNMREFFARREPIAGFLIFGVASDMCEKWFTVNDTSTSHPDPELDAAVQRALNSMNKGGKWSFKQTNEQLITFDATLGKALLVGGFEGTDTVTQLVEKKPRGAKLTHVAAYKRGEFSVSETDTDPVSPRCGLPVTYLVKTAGGQHKIHYTRCYELQTNFYGDGVLDLIFDDLYAGRSIRWGVAQYIFRVGGGFLIVEMPATVGADAQGNGGRPTTQADLEAWNASGSFSEFTNRNYLTIIKDVMNVRFEGAAGAAINPEPYFDTNTKQIAKATGFPKSILEGAEAGALTGSEKNDQQYYKRIAGKQRRVEGGIRWVIDCMIESGQITRKGTATQTVAQDAKHITLKRIFNKAKIALIRDQPDEETDLNYTLDWNNSFELSALDEARVENLNEETNTKRLEYMTPDEVRAMQTPKLDPLPNGEGETLKAAAATNPFAQNPTNTNLGGGFQPIDSHIDALPPLRDLLQPLLKQVLDKEITAEVAKAQGIHQIEYYIGVEKQRAADWNKQHISPLAGTLSPEQEMDFKTQQDMYTQTFLSLLVKAEKLVEAKQP